MTPLVKVIRGRLGVYDGRNTGIIDYHLLKLRAEWLTIANKEWNVKTLERLDDVRSDQDLLLDARLEIM